MKKKFKILFMCFMLFGVASCKKYDNSPEIDNNIKLTDSNNILSSNYYSPMMYQFMETTSALSIPQELVDMLIAAWENDELETALTLYESDYRVLNHEEKLNYGWINDNRFETDLINDIWYSITLRGSTDGLIIQKTAENQLDEYQYLIFQKYFSETNEILWQDPIIVNGTGNQHYLIHWKEVNFFVIPEWDISENQMVGLAIYDFNNDIFVASIKYINFESEIVATENYIAIDFNHNNDLIWSVTDVPAFQIWPLKNINLAIDNPDYEIPYRFSHGLFVKYISDIINENFYNEIKQSLVNGDINALMETNRTNYKLLSIDEIELIIENENSGILKNFYCNGNINTDIWYLLNSGSEKKDIIVKSPHDTLADTYIYYFFECDEVLEEQTVFKKSKTVLGRSEEYGFITAKDAAEKDKNYLMVLERDVTTGMIRNLILYDFESGLNALAFVLGEDQYYFYQFIGIIVDGGRMPESYGKWLPFQYE